MITNYQNIKPTSAYVFVQNGNSCNPSSSYRVTVNNRMADGSYNLFVLKEGVNRTEGPLVRDALVDYLETFSPVAPGPMNRIAVVK